MIVGNFYIKLTASIIIAALSISLSAEAQTRPIPGKDAPSGFDIRQDESLGSWLSKTEFTGQLRAYYFSQFYENIRPSQLTNSVGGWFKLETPDISGFNLGLAAYTAQNIGSREDARENTSLPNKDVTTLGQAYLQYKNAGLKLRLGRQPIETPLAESMGVDYRMIPPFYEALGGHYKLPSENLEIHGYKVFRFKGYGYSGFNKLDTGANPSNQIGVLPQTSSSGFETIGVKSKYRNSNLDFWYYHFDNRLNAFYTEGSHRIDTNRNFLKSVSLSAQFSHEWDTSDQKGDYKDVDSDLYGIEIAAQLPYNEVALSYNEVTSHPGAYRGGGFISPYQQGNYNTTRFFTNQLGASLSSVDVAPGRAYSLNDTIRLPNHGLTLAFGYTHLDSPELVRGSNGFFKGSGSNAHSYQLVARYQISENWKLQSLLARIDRKGPLGSIQVAHFYLTYDFGG